MAFLTIRRPSRLSRFSPQIGVLLALWCPPDWFLLDYSEPLWQLRPLSVTTPGRRIAWRFLQPWLFDAFPNVRCPPEYSALFSLYFTVLISAALHIKRHFLGDCMGVANPSGRACPNAHMLGTPLLGIH